MQLQVTGEINKILKVLIFSPTTAIFVFVTVAGPSLYLNSMISSKNNIMPKLIFFSCLSVHQEENLVFFLRESVRYVYVKQCCTVSFKKQFTYKVIYLTSERNIFLCYRLCYSKVIFPSFYMFAPNSFIITSPLSPSFGKLQIQQ